MLWEDHRNDLFINGFGERLGGQLVKVGAIDSQAPRSQVSSCPPVGVNSGGVSAVSSNCRGATQLIAFRSRSRPHGRRHRE